MWKQRDGDKREYPVHKVQNEMTRCDVPATLYLRVAEACGSTSSRSVDAVTGGQAQQWTAV